MKNPDYYMLIGEFNREEINFEEYLKGRGLNKANKLTKLEECIPLINEKPKSLNMFLGKISIGVRCLTMKAVFDLTDRQIADNVRIVRSVIGDFIKENLEMKNNPNIYSSRNFSGEFIRELSIILDLPYRFLADSQAEFKMINIFEEYERDIIKLVSLKQLLVEILTKIKEESLNRKIFSIKVRNNFLEDINLLYFFTRVDIRESFFTIELFLDSSGIIKYSTVNYLKNLINELKLKGEIYYRDAFLRDNKKLIIFIWSKNTDNIIDVPYLSKDLLLERQMYS